MLEQRKPFVERGLVLAIQIKPDGAEIARARFLGIERQRGVERGGGIWRHAVAVLAGQHQRLAQHREVFGVLGIEHGRALHRGRRLGIAFGLVIRPAEHPPALGILGIGLEPGLELGDDLVHRRLCRSGRSNGGGRRLAASPHRDSARRQRDHHRRAQRDPPAARRGSFRCGSWGGGFGGSGRGFRCFHSGLGFAHWSLVRWLWRWLSQAHAYRGAARGWQAVRIRR